jgi:hypothetical protein
MSSAYTTSNSPVTSQAHINHKEGEKSYPIIYDTLLGKALSELGFTHPAEATLFLHQTAHWMTTSSGYQTKDGKKWVYNSYKDWIKKQFATLSESQFGRMFRMLRKCGFVISSCFAKLKKQLVEEPSVPWHEWNTTTWLTLDFARIYEVTGWLPPGMEKPPDKDCEEVEEEENKETTPPEAVKAQESAGAGNTANTTEELEQENSSKPAPSTDIQFCTTDDSNLNDPSFKIELSSIYKENHTHNQTTAENDLEKEKTNSVDNSGEGLDNSSVVATPQEPKEEECRRSSDIPKKRTKKVVVDVVDEVDEVQEPQYVWEIAKDKPFPVFLNWWASAYYKLKGGEWEVAAYRNAYNEFYNNPKAVTNALFPQFMKELKVIVERVNQGQFNKVEAANVLPSWFIEEYPDPTPENIQQLMINLDIVIERGVKVALPSKAATPSSLTADYSQVQEQSKIKPLPQLQTPALPKPDKEPEEAQEPSEETISRKNIMWRNPHLRQKVREWVEQTPGVVLTDDGVVRESELAPSAAQPTIQSATCNKPSYEPTNPTFETDNLIVDPWAGEEYLEPY